MKSIYIIGSLRNSEIPTIGNAIRQLGYDVFDDWHAAGPTADDCWKEYEQSRGRNYQTALNGWAAKHVFEFDLCHLDRCDMALLVLPAGRSGHLELGYCIGRGKTGLVLMDNPDRWDVMYQFAHGVFFSLQDLLTALPRNSPATRGTGCRAGGEEAPGGALSSMCGTDKGESAPGKHFPFMSTGTGNTSGRRGADRLPIDTMPIAKERMSLISRAREEVIL